LIAPAARKVFAVEIDPSLVRYLVDSVPDNVEVMEGDILELDLPEFDKVIGNIPYSISSPLIFRLLEHDFELGVLCLQRQFAQRLVANPGSSDYSRLSAMISIMTERTLLALKIPRKAFYPVPEVDSAVVILFPDSSAEYPDQVSAEIIRMIFCHKKKKLKNAVADSERQLRERLKIDSAEILDRVDTDWDKRVFEMGPDEILDFCRAVKSVI